MSDTSPTKAHASTPSSSSRKGKAGSNRGSESAKSKKTRSMASTPVTARPITSFFAKTPTTSSPQPNQDIISQQTPILVPDDSPKHSNSACILEVKETLPHAAQSSEEVEVPMEEAMVVEQPLLLSEPIISEANTAPAAVDLPVERLVELKNGKVVFREKKMNLDKQPSTIGALSEFYKFRSNQKTQLDTITTEFKNLMALLIQDRECTMNQLVAQIKASLFPDLDDDEESPCFSDDVIGKCVESLSTRVNYGISTEEASPAGLAIWRWEVSDKTLLGDLQEKVEARVALRMKAKEDLQTLWAALPSEEQQALLTTKKHKKLKAAEDSPAKTPDVETVKAARIAEQERKQLEKAQREQQKAEAKQAKELERKKKEQERQEAKEARELEKKKKEDDKLKATKSQPSLAKYFTQVVKKEEVAKHVDADNELVAFWERFPPFHVRRGVVVAKLNRFWHELPETFVEDLLQPRDDDDQILSLQSDFNEFCARGKESIRRTIRKKTVTADLDPADPLARFHGQPWKLLHFAENVRPAYYGTWLKRSRDVNGRKPFGKDLTYLNYEVDSEEEWEEDEPGEELRSEEDEESDGGDPGSDEELDDWLVPDGYLSPDEADEPTAPMEPTEKGAKPKKAAPLVPVILGPYISGHAADPPPSLFLQFEIVPLFDRPCNPFAEVESAQVVPEAATATPSGRKQYFDEPTCAELKRMIERTVLTMPKIVELAKQKFVMIPKSQIEAKIKEIAVKEKRAGDERQKWYIKTGESALRVGEGATVDGSLKRKLE